MKIDIDGKEVELSEDTLMDFINGGYEIPERRDMGKQVDYVLMELNKILAFHEEFQSSSNENKSHVFECIGAFCFNMMMHYSGIDVESVVNKQYEKKMKSFYLKACEFKQEMEFMMKMHARMKGN